MWDGMELCCLPFQKWSLSSGLPDIYSSIALKGSAFTLVIAASTNGGFLANAEYFLSIWSLDYVAVAVVLAPLKTWVSEKCTSLLAQ